MMSEKYDYGFICCDLCDRVLIDKLGCIIDIRYLKCSCGKVVINQTTLDDFLVYS